MVQPINTVQNFKNMSTKQKAATVAGAAATAGLIATGVVIGAKKGKACISKIANVKGLLLSTLNIAKCKAQAFILNGAAKVLNGIAKIFGK